MKKIEYTEVYPKIFVYKNMFEDIDTTFNIIKNSQDSIWPDLTVEEATAKWRNGEGQTVFKPWFEWYTFGTTTDEYNPSISSTEYNKVELKVIDEIKDIFNQTMDHYMNTFGYTKDGKEWSMMGPSFCRYIDSHGVTDDLAMQYHPDYQLENEEQPGNKFAFTCTMYLNDDYDGGDISFLRNNEVFNYKPKAGDVILFPAGDPSYLSEDGVYYHGVKKCFNGDKYFIRMNSLYWYEGSEKWHANRDKYGDQLWQEMEQERKLAERYNNQHHVSVPENAIYINE